MWLTIITFLLVLIAIPLLLTIQYGDEEPGKVLLSSFLLVVAGAIIGYHIKSTKIYSLEDYEIQTTYKTVKVIINGVETEHIDSTFVIVKK